jgi:hypothetical protein
MIFFNRKKIHSIVMQAICDVNKKLCNVYVGQLGGVHWSRQFKMFNVYRQLKSREILQEPMMVVKRCEIYTLYH